MTVDTTTGPITDLSTAPGRAFDGLPTTTDELVVIPRHLFIHEFLATPMYGITDLAAADQELETRTADGLVQVILNRKDAPLTADREPADRVIGNCRQFALLAVALLRRAGLPARLRGGFAAYLGQDWNDHWIVERPSSDGNGWVRTDPQVDDVQQQAFGIDFDPLDLPEEAFLSGSQAWQRCRAGKDDPGRFGIADLHGEWFIACNAVRDLAAISGMEPHVWDTWGVMDELIEQPVPNDIRQLLDEVADAVTADDADRIATLVADPRIAPRQTVTSHRTGQLASLW